MKEDLLTSEATVLEALASIPSGGAYWTQRGLAKQTGYSIGLINTILKKLTKTGYIKIATINKKRIQYLLTTKGFAATSRVAYNYVLRTFRDYHKLYIQIAAFFQNLSDKGHQKFYVSCEDQELKQLLQVVLQDCGVTSLANQSSADATHVQLKGATIAGAGPSLKMEVVSGIEGGAK